MLTKEKPRFLDEWTPAQFEEMQSRIVKHFKKMPRIFYDTADGIKWKSPSQLGSGFEGVDTFLGLAYTSSSSYAGYWTCNVDVRNPENMTYRYNHFAITKATENGHRYIAVLSNESEQQMYLEI
jgi:hypothetical protein